jgi:demethylmenaquinone methyltransferase / 2-methoxy-6-polyprenyl-1,4-benzoquinol methylase
MTPESGTEIVDRFFAGTSHSYDTISNLCTFGLDRWWKRKIIERIPPRSTLIMDQACGTGILSCEIARRFPNARIVGVDMTAEYLNIARKKAQETGLTNIEFLLGRAEEVDVGYTDFDCVTSSYLAKYADLSRLVPGFAKLLRNRGTVILHDFTYPKNRPFARLWGFYFILLQNIVVLKYPEWRSAFYGLPGLLRQSSWVQDVSEKLIHHGFTDVGMEYFTMGTAAIVTGRKAED